MREALHTALLGVTDLVRIDAAAQRAALEELHARWAAAVGRASLLIDTDDQPAVRLVVGGVPALLVLDRAADAAVDILRSGHLHAFAVARPTAVVAAGSSLIRPATDRGAGAAWLTVDRTSRLVASPSADERLVPPGSGAPAPLGGISNEASVPENPRDLQPHPLFRAIFADWNSRLGGAWSAQPGAPVLSSKPRRRW